MKPFKDIILKAIWTDNIRKEEVLDFINTQDRVFKNSYSVKKFEKKYNDNIYGKSLIILAYLDNKCVGARAFWRNDIEGMKAYQPCDTAVLEDYRGYGIFTKINDKGLKNIEENTLIYNFPNDNSLPGNLKMGWKIHSRRRYKIFNPIINSKEIMKVDEKYFEWLLNDTNSKNIDLLKYVCLNKKYYLLRKRAKNIYLIIGEIHKESALFISKAKFPILLHYSSKGYIGRGIVTVIRNTNKEINIPLYKIDTLF
ncbi:GNAT family N-acetyltransferase [Proteiniborus sp.]|uniref:GNAT family N-acetyltransferase n=1 Tax=Proteiniborus sp. TaxID=2079015 RepID=UPI003321B1F4